MSAIGGSGSGGGWGDERNIREKFLKEKKDKKRERKKIRDRYRKRKKN